MTKARMALAELAEKGADADFLREMIQYVAQRLMEMDVDQDLDQGVDLVFLANRAEFEEGETSVHGQDHDAAKQDEQGICALFECVHEKSPCRKLVLVRDWRQNRVCMADRTMSKQELHQ